MPQIRAALRAGATVISVAGFCATAAAETPQTHGMSLMLPSGGVARIQYAGNTPPQVYISDAPAVFAAFPSVFGPDSPFAEMERISAALDRQAAHLVQRAAVLSDRPDGLLNAATVGGLPAETREYQFVSTITGNGVCSRSVEITSQGNGAAPRVVTHTSGDCGPAASGGIQVPTQQPVVTQPSNGPKMIMTKATGAQPYAGRVQEAALHQ